MGSMAQYDGQTLTLELNSQNQIESDVFKATAANYEQRLHSRADMSRYLKYLIAGLFEAGVITECKISWGRHIEMRIAQQAQGRLLLIGERLERFKTAFRNITHTPLDVTWSDAPRSNVARTVNSRAGKTIAAAFDKFLTSPPSRLELGIWAATD